MREVSGLIFRLISPIYALETKWNSLNLRILGIKRF
jgi:hypothetical protein